MVMRSRLERYFDVLEVTSYGIHKPSKIMFEANYLMPPDVNHLKLWFTVIS